MKEVYVNNFRKELQVLINRHSRENGSNTPDFILAEYLTDCLLAFDKANNRREKWFGRGHGRYNSVPHPEPFSDLEEEGDING